ncbi:hypothetical protein [Actinacidiphila glaucinigra]|uniref:hypothetical protein n=1 Tax=Actinacidiphila glaucinigra TaxID=235986 RepID=UPI003715270B
MTTSIALWFEHLAGKHWHNDLRLHIGRHRHTCDSYYLTLESRHLGANLARLLEQWIDQVNELKGAGGTAYLPYDFSDQCTAWLRVSSTDGHTTVIEAGWSLIEAWGIDPSDYRATAPDVTDFEPIANARIECSLDDLATHIALNRGSFATLRH